MQPLFEAIKCRFDTDPTLSGVVTGLYLNRAPQNTNFPYIVYFLVSGMGSNVFSGRSFDTHSIQFNIHSNNPSAVEVCTIYEYLINRFDNCSMNMTDYSTVQMKRDAFGLLEDEERFWLYFVTYSVIVQQKT